MDLGRLSLKERLLLCERVEEACLRRLHEIARRSDPGDGPLRDFLGHLIREEEGHLAGVRGFAERTLPPVPDGAAGALLESMILSRFPSLSQGFGEGILSRDNALYFAECVQKESSRFYRELSDGAPDAESRDFFRRAAEGGESLLKHIQTILL